MTTAQADPEGLLYERWDARQRWRRPDEARRLNTGLRQARKPRGWIAVPDDEAPDLPTTFRLSPF